MSDVIAHSRSFRLIAKCFEPRCEASRWNPSECVCAAGDKVVPSRGGQ